VKRSVSVDRRKAEFIVTSYTQTPPGFWQMNGHFSRVPCDAEATELGHAVLEALDASNRITLRDVDASSNSFAPVLAELGLRNFAQYMKGAVSVSVKLGDDDILRITPMRNGGAREGFVYITDKVRVVEDRSVEALGIAVQDAMAESG
jgi:CDI immunity protein